MDKKKLLANTPLFKKLRPEELDLIASVTDEFVIKKGDYVYKQGEMGHAFYVIAEGTVELIVKGDDGIVSVIGYMTCGDHFGELSLLTGSPRSRSVRAIENLTLLSLEKLVFDEILLGNPRMHRLLDEALAERLRKASRNTMNIIKEDTAHQIELKKKENELIFLNKLNSLVNTDLSFEEIQDRIVELLFNIFDLDLCELNLVTEKNIINSNYRGNKKHDEQINEKKVSFIHNAMQSKNTFCVENKTIAGFGNSYSEYNSALVVPLMYTADSTPLGILILYALESNVFKNEDIEIFKFLASHIAQVLKNVQFYQESRRQRDELEALSRIGIELNASYDLPSLLYKIVSLTASLMKVDGVILQLKDQNENVLRIKSYYGITDEEARTVTQKIGEGIAGKVAEHGKSIISNDVSNDPNFLHNISGHFRSVLCVPLFMKGNVIGTMTVYNKKINNEWQPFIDDDQRLLNTIASQASIAIENARIFSDRIAKVSVKEELLKSSDFIGESNQAQKIRNTIAEFSANIRPILLYGEPGSGKKIAAKQIHLESPNHDGPYIEVDVRRFEPRLWGGELFGYEKEAFTFAPVKRLGYLEQFKGGTVVLSHIENLDKNVQLKLMEALKNGHFQPLGGKRKIILNVRLIFSLDDNADVLINSGNFNKDFYNILKEQSFELPPLKSRKRDIPALVKHYLERFGKENFKEIKSINPDAINILMNYDWPGNLTELSNVIERAVILSETGEILSEQILLGLPRAEGKFGYNLLRFDKIRKIFTSPYFPILPKALITVFFFIGVIFLFIGPNDPKYNIGLSITWVYGWTTLVFSAFFMSRIWCSICSLSMPGYIAQKIFKPKRKAPRLIVKYSEWIMTILCILILWLEVVWNAFYNPPLTGFIILTIASGSLIYSIFFERGVWCRYVCPLGAMNAMFSMTSIIELRSNRDLCTNRCRTHACYKGTSKFAGCPMYDHPFLIDNNRDCTLCGNCIKNCENQSIQLNIRIAPDELWTIRSFRMAHSFLIVALGTILFFFIKHEEFYRFANRYYTESFVSNVLPEKYFASVIFFSAILFSWICYNIVCYIESKRSHAAFLDNVSGLSYGFIPLILGGYMGHYLELFISKALMLISGILLLFHYEKDFSNLRILTPGATATLKTIILMFALGLSLYATFKIVERLNPKKEDLFSKAIIPMSFAFIFGLILIFII